jgi:hypothetical protein
MPLAGTMTTMSTMMSSDAIGAENIMQVALSFRF